MPVVPENEILHEVLEVKKEGEIVLSENGEAKEMISELKKEGFNTKEKILDMLAEISFIASK